MKIWLYYAKSGGGHKAPAEALAKDLKKLYPETETKLVDLAEKASVFFRASIENGYTLLSHHLEWLYAFIFQINNFGAVIKIENLLADFFVKPAIKAQLVVDAPDVVVSTHFLVSPVLCALKELKKNIPVFVLVTDPHSASPVWFNQKNVNYIVYSEEIKKIAVKRGVAEERVAVFNQIANHSTPVLNSEQKNSIKKELDIDVGKKFILMIGGAEGFPNGEKIYEALLKSKPDAEVVAILGNNKKQENNFSELSKKYSFGKVLGWVEEPMAILGTADLLITKAGAGVVWESLLLKKPLLIAHYIYGQERGNMEYVVANSFGWYQKNPEKIAKKVKEVIKDQEIEDAVKKIESFKFVPGNNDVANYIYRIATERGS